MFKYAELAEDVRPNDKPFIGLLNKVPFNNIDDDVHTFFQARFIHKSDEKYPKVDLHI